MNTRHFFKRYCRHVCVKDFLVKKAMRRHLANKKKKGIASIAQLLVINCLC